MVYQYFSLCWISVAKSSLNDEQKHGLKESQFKTILQMENHTFSGTFLPYLLTLHMKTKRMCDFWRIFAVKPIRYAIEDFALVTGLNCKPGRQTSLVAGNIKENRKIAEQDDDIMDFLFSTAETATMQSIIDKLKS